MPSGTLAVHDLLAPGVTEKVIWGVSQVDRRPLTHDLDHQSHLHITGDRLKPSPEKPDSSIETASIVRQNFRGDGKLHHFRHKIGQGGA